jgi:hypothetical protein
MEAMLFKCEKCGGAVVVTTLRTRSSEVFVAGTTTIGSSPVEAHVCVECGTLTLYAQSPGALRVKGEIGAKQYELGEIRSKRG